MAKIYLVERDASISSATYDVFNGFVVVARNEAHARNICAESAADEGKESWTSAEVTILGEPTDKKARIILGDFNAG